MLNFSIFKKQKRRVCMKTQQRPLYFGVFFLIAAGIIFSGCKKSEETANVQDSESKSVSEDAEDGPSVSDSYSYEMTPVLHFIDPASENLFNLPFSTSAHEEHLKDTLAFKNIPDGGIPNGPTAVVGSGECLFYPVKSISSEDELKKLPKGEPIPFGTIIALGDRLESNNSDIENMFAFQDNYNYFYKTTWNKKEGIVFGADLFGIGSSNMANRINSLLYKNNGHFENFYPAAGYDEIGAEIQKELEKNGLAFQEVRMGEYDLNAALPDDMISLYSAINKKVTPVFVTTDLAAHANHLVFDRVLQYLEENHFFAPLVTLTNEYIKAIEQKKGQVPEDVYAISLQYLQVAQGLLALAPRKVEVKKDWTSEIEYQNVDAAQVLRNYSPQVIEEIQKINDAGGPETSFLGNREDYSQYKVRGHYTKNGILGAYFRTLMWFGRINFNLGGDNESARESASRLAPAALFITDITENSPKLKQLWESLFDPITALIGASDDISFYELIPLWNKVKGAGFAQWYSDPEKVNTFISGEYKNLRPPVISGNSLFDGSFDGGPELEKRLPPMGWRLFGQRYTLDSEIHHNASSPRLFGRTMVQGLDILKVFGSKTADRLLRENDYPKWPELEKVLNGMQQSLGNEKDDFWLSTYYTNILYQIRTQAVFENGAGFYFTEKPGWNLKAMNSAHGTWAELRHDTILYVKQSYAEMSGGRVDPTFRTKPLPLPVHYIEPNVPFWITSAMGIQKMYTVLDKYHYLDEKTGEVLAGMHRRFVIAAEISGQEAENQAVSRTDLTWISNFADELAALVLVNEGNSSGYTDNPDNLRMALIADVFTDSDTGKALETAVGIPYRLYIPLNDKQGGKRIAVGYGFSYYEFVSDSRYTNEEWKEIVYRDYPDVKKFLPSWMQGQVQPAK
jgi:hypothetical protein